MNCSIVGEKYIPQLKKLWNECYPEDTDEYLNAFFEKCFPLSKCVVGLENDMVVGVIYLFPCRILNENVPAFYFYAGGVFKSQRGHGYYREIIDFAIKYSKDLGREFVCLPLPHLIDFYDDMGFTQKYYHTFRDYSVSEIQSEHNFQMRDITTQEVLKMMEKSAGNGYILWELEVMEYILGEYPSNNGFCRKVIVDDKDEYYIFARKETECIKIIETSMPPKIIEEFTNDLLSEFGGDKIVAQVFADEGDEKQLSCASSKHIKEPTKWFTLIML